MSIQEYIIAGSKLPFHNHYQLRLIRLESQPACTDISMLKFSGSEAISNIPHYETEFTSTVRDIPAQHITNSSALFLMYPDGKPWESVKPRIIPGVITQFRQCGTSADETRYIATLEHRVTLLNQGCNNAIYQNESVISITENTLLRDGMDRLDFRFALNDQYPRKPFMMQFGESEYVHIARRLADSGISYFFEYDEENNYDVMVMADHTCARPEPVEIPFRNPAGMFDGGLELVWNMSVNRKSIPKTVTLNDDHYPAAQSDMTASATTNPDYPALVAEDYRWGEYYPEPGKEHSSEPGQGLWYARLRQERYLSEQTVFEGQSNCMTLRPGMVITTPGKEWPEAQDGLLIVSTESKNVTRDTAYFVTFTAVPRHFQHPYRPALLPWPTVSGTLPARISSACPDEPYAHISADGLYRVRFGFDRTEWQKGFESCWLRLAKPYSGDTYSFHMPLLDSTGVAIAFEKGDADRPYIACALHDSMHPDHVALPNCMRNVIRTSANNKLRLDDTRGKEHIKLSTPASGKSQLNLGALVDDKRQDRGHGAELRTDDWVSVRGGKGVFISADRQASATGQQLDMQQAKALLSSALVEMQSLSASAQQAQALAADIDCQQTLLQQKLAQLQQAVLLLSAPKGIGIVSGESMQLYAEQSLTLTAAKQIDDENRYLTLKDYTHCNDGNIYYHNDNKQIKTKLWRLSKGTMNYKGKFIWAVKKDDVLAIPFVSGDNDACSDHLRGCAYSILSVSNDGGKKFSDIKFSVNNSSSSKEYTIVVADDAIYIKSDKYPAAKYAINSEDEFYKGMIELGVPEDVLDKTNPMGYSYGLLTNKYHYSEKQLNTLVIKASDLFDTYNSSSHTEKLPDIKRNSVASDHFHCDATQVFSRPKNQG